MVCKIRFTNWNAKITVLRASMIITYNIKLFRTGADRHNGILMSLRVFSNTKNVLFLNTKNVLFLNKMKCIPFKNSVLNTENVLCSNTKNPLFLNTKNMLLSNTKNFLFRNTKDALLSNNLQNLSNTFFQI